MGSPSAVPWMLRVLFVGVGVQVLVDAVVLAAAPSRTEIALGAFGLGLDLAVLAALAYGSETVRGLLRGAAAVGLVYDAFQVARWLVTGTQVEGAVLAGVLAGALLAGSAFVVWALGHADVQRWVFDRWLARQR
jgi:hypothetical protein